MSTTEYTPGPWNLHTAYNGEPMVVEGSNGSAWVHWNRKIAKGQKIIGTVEAHTCSNGGFPGVDNRLEMEANARLMVAAPELLESLEAFCSALSGDPTDINMARTEELYDGAMAAIRKAKGEA